MEYKYNMTLHQAIKEMRSLGWKFVKHHGTYEIWETNLGYVQVPNANIVPKYLERQIKQGVK